MTPETRVSPIIPIDRARRVREIARQMDPSTARVADFLEQLGPKWIALAVAALIAAAAVAFGPGCGNIEVDEDPDARALVERRGEAIPPAGAGGSGLGGAQQIEPGTGGALVASGMGGAAAHGAGGAIDGAGGAPAAGSGGAGLAGAPGGAPGTGGAAAIPPLPPCSTDPAAPPVACPGGKLYPGTTTGCFSCAFRAGSPDIGRACIRGATAQVCSGGICQAPTYQACVDCGGCS
jgi:hypothetical protein